MWNNRIFKREIIGKKGDKHIVYGMRETYYIHDPVKRIMCFDDASQRIDFYESPHDLIESLARMLSDAIKYKDEILDPETIEIKPINTDIDDENTDDNDDSDSDRDYNFDEEEKNEKE